MTRLNSPFLEVVANDHPQGETDDIPEEILDQAVAWTVRLESGTVTDIERTECAAWREADPAHEQAWQQVQAVEKEFRKVPAGANQLAYDTLEAAGHDHGDHRRRTLKLLLLGAVSLALGGYALRQKPWQQRAVYMTAVGKRRRVILEDGTELELNTGSDVEVVFSPLRRLIVLEQGEAFIHTGHDTDSLTGRRAFWVETAQARLEAIGTRFSVRRLANETRVHVTDGKVAIHAGQAPVRLAKAGDTFAVGDASPVPRRLDNAAYDPAAWIKGVLIAKQMRLDDFIAELSRYSETPLRCDPQVAGLRVSGVFQLDGPDPVGRALDVLARALPVVIVNGRGSSISITRG